MAVKSLGKVNTSANTDGAVPAVPVAPTGEGTPVNAPAPSTGKKGDTVRVQKYAEFKQTGENIRANYDDESKNVEGSKSNTLLFVIPLGNPAVQQKRVEKGTNLASSLVVGYRLKTLEDITVPVCEPGDSGEHMDYKSISEKPVKAGEEFDVSLPELGLLISRIEYGGVINTKEDPVQLHVTITGTRNEPLTVLKRPDAPIKDKILDIATKDATGKWTVKPEFAEKFGHYFTRKSALRGGSSGQKREVGQSAKDLAAAFRAYSAKKNANIGK